MKFLISDTNIIVDFHEGGILTELFRLSAAIAVSDVMYAEELEHWLPDLPALGLRVLELKEIGVGRAVALARLYRRTSRNDLLALALAEQEGCLLVTGDRDLRDAARREHVEVRGTLWVAGCLVEERVLEPPLLRTAYLRMRERGRRLPWQEVDVQLRQFGEQDLSSAASGSSTRRRLIGRLAGVESATELRTIQGHVVLRKTPEHQPQPSAG